MTADRPPGFIAEALALREWQQLVADPIYYGAGLPRGDGRLVLVPASRNPDAEHIEVSGSHSGLVYNRAVYQAVARALACSD